MNLFWLRKTWLRTVGVCISVLVMLTVSYSPPTTPRAEATISVIDVNAVGQWVVNLANQAKDFVVQKAMELHQWWLVFKDKVLDGLVWQLINITLQQLSKSIVSWINSGFKDSPAFITDFRGFMTGVADKVAGNFIYGSDLGFLCSPFQLNVRLALRLQYKQTRNFQTQCTLTQVVSNMERFLNGDFMAGGWNGWYSMTNNPVNNQYGALLLAQDELSVRIGKAKFEQKNMLDWGKGFFSVRDPECRPNPDNPDEFNEELCTLVTPGTAIETQLNKALSLPAERLTVADEFNEILSALFSQLAQQAITGAHGLLGLTGGGGSSSNYFSQIDIDQNIVGLQGSPNDNLIKDALDTEQNYFAFRNSVVSSLSNAENYKDDKYGPNNSCHSGDLPFNLQKQYEAVRADADSTRSLIQQLSTLNQQFIAAAGQPASQELVMQQFDAIVQSGVLHSPVDSVIIEVEEIPEVRNEIAAFTAQVDAQCSSTSGGGP